MEIYRITGLSTLALAAAASPALASPDRVVLDEINGLSIDTLSGLVVAGSWGERRAYLPLDRNEIMPRFIGVWSSTPEGCSVAPKTPNGVTRTQNAVIIIRSDGVVSKSGILHVRRAYVHAPATITRERIETGKAIVLKAGANRRAGEMLILFDVSDLPGKSVGMQMQLSDDGGTLRIGKGLPRTPWRRCSPA